MGQLVILVELVKMEMTVKMEQLVLMVKKDYKDYKVTLDSLEQEALLE